jgi:hypothetical protein
MIKHPSKRAGAARTVTRTAPPGLVSACLAGLLAACQGAAPEAQAPPPVSAAEAVAPPPIDWAGAADCQAKLGLLAEAARSGHWRSDERPPIAVVLPGRADQSDWLAPPSVTVTADLPLELHERSDPALRQTPCVVIVEPARDQRVAQRLIGRETVRSLYESGVRSERNPDYDAAQLRVRQAERSSREKGPGILRVGDPVLDMFGLLLGGVISGFSEGSNERDLDDAMTALAETPRSLERPVYRPYSFERETVLAGREATVPIALVDQTSRRLWQAQLHRRESRRFEIVEDLDPRDRDFEQLSTASVTRDEFERWQSEPPQLELSAIVAALREARPAPAGNSLTTAIARLDTHFLGAEPQPIGALPDIASGPVAEAAARDYPLAEAAGASGLAPGAGAAPTPGGDPRAASVLRVANGGRDGSGVYVRADLVLTTAQLVAGSSVVDVVAADGARVLGLVARTDQARNLALVQVARPGPPVAFYDGPPVPAGRAVEAVALAEGAGVVLTPGRYRAAGTSPVALAQVDARPPPVPPEGLPWFLGDRVVGLGTGGAGEGAPGPLPAVRASEVLEFLYGAGGALGQLP